MRLSRVYLGCICIVVLSGCSIWGGEKIVIKNVPVYVPVVCPDTSPPNPIITRPIKPRAIKDMAGIWWVALTPEDYQNLSINTKETIRFIVDQRGVVEYYRECIITFNGKIENLRNEADQIRGQIDG